MNKINYYVLGKEESFMLKKYLNKYYLKLINYLLEIKNSGYLKNEIKKILKIENKIFILNSEISSLINYIYSSVIINDTEKVLDFEVIKSKLKKEISIFILEGIKSPNLSLNKGFYIPGTKIKITDLDLNPYSKEDIHPEHLLNGAIAGNWGIIEKNIWIDSYKKSLSILKKIDKGFYFEINYLISKIIPLGTAPLMHNSSSYKECIGNLYMGYTIGVDKPEFNNIQSLIHELSHNKLNLIAQFDPIILNNKDENYYSSIRPDARHVYGIFLGYHAFAPTMFIIMKIYIKGYMGNDQSWLKTIVLYYYKTKLLQKVIKKYAIFTKKGLDICNEIDFVITEIDLLFKEIKPDKKILLKAKIIQKEHFDNVNKKFSNLKY